MQRSIATGHPSIRPSVRLSHFGIVAKRIQRRSLGLHRRIASSVIILDFGKVHLEIPTESPRARASNHYMGHEALAKHYAYIRTCCPLFDERGFT